MRNTDLPSDFIREIVDEDVKAGKNEGKVVTRFPPEPNGYLHIGHAKSICLNFGVASEYQGGICHLRFDDTNPCAEEERYVESIREDVKWLGFDWQGNLFFASDYFDKLYEFAVELIKKGKAFVCDLSSDQIREYRGSPPAPGRESPYRDRSIEENLALFERMRRGEFDEGERVLRAKIDMASSNIHMRDPVIYRILKVSHHRTADKWKVYPMYDFAHCLSDAVEGITHSICTLEFEVHRPLYEWILAQLDVPCHPRQIEFARLNLSYTVMSKRKLLELVNGGVVAGWDDPRMPTLAGMRRRGFTPASIRNFCSRIGVTKYDGMTDVALLEHSAREDLNKSAERRMAVLNPLRLVITNYPEDATEEVEAVNNPEAPEAGTRRVPFSRVLYIEQDDFMEEPPKKFHRLYPGNEVRLKYAYIVKCTDVVKDESGRVIEVRCTYDPETRSGGAGAARKVKGTIHWVSAAHAFDTQVRLYDRLFTVEDPTDTEGDWKEFLNPESLEVLETCKLEPALSGAAAGERVQFERVGYFCVDAVDSSPGRPVFNRIVSLKDRWAKLAGKR
ncbi:MAG: glutamine--tRNA ligase/YqeY domain fusion protein [Verrucomicrobia bacterium]|nr:glutamine--tRNA ligase/YqeY domain fusion protein [Verrucomicrobiota bacterium]MCF7707451.1 glutamine--tRNA ligase/YqeY domain fusion protein [Verrucomicrobiota bacterium]